MFVVQSIPKSLFKIMSWIAARNPFEAYNKINLNKSWEVINFATETVGNAFAAEQT